MRTFFISLIAMILGGFGCTTQSQPVNSWLDPADFADGLFCITQDGEVVCMEGRPITEQEELTEIGVEEFSCEDFTGHQMEIILLPEGASPGTFLKDPTQELFNHNPGQMIVRSGLTGDAQWITAAPDGAGVRIEGLHTIRITTKQCGFYKIGLIPVATDGTLCQAQMDWKQFRRDCQDDTIVEAPMNHEPEAVITATYKIIGNTSDGTEYEVFDGDQVPQGSFVKLTGENSTHIDPADPEYFWAIRGIETGGEQFPLSGYSDLYASEQGFYVDGCGHLSIILDIQHASGENSPWSPYAEEWILKVPCKEQ